MSHREHSSILPFVATCKGSWQMLVEGWRALPLVYGLSFAALFAASILPVPMHSSQENILLQALTSLGPPALRLAGGAFLLSSCFRWQLIEDGGGRTELQQWTRGETRILWSLVGVVVLLRLGGFALGLLSVAVLTALAPIWRGFEWSLPLAMSLLLSYAIVRLSLVLPAIAIDGPGQRLEESWKASRGHGLRLFALSVVTCLPLYALLLPASLWTDATIPQQLATATLEATHLFTTVIVQAGVLSRGYRDLVLRAEEEPVTDTEAPVAG